MNPQVDSYFNEATAWRAELAELRRILLDAGLTEELKWKIPCYTVQGSNIAGLAGLKDFCALSFFKGVLLKDPEGILVLPGENTQAGRWIKFARVEEIIRLEPVLRDYVREAIEVEKSGVKVGFKETSDYAMPEELQNKLEAEPAFKTAFESLTPGRQRGYLLHFSAPKQSKTREVRIEKCLPRILDGKGLNDCTCGLSKKLPACDGSHKFMR